VGRPFYHASPFRAQSAPRQDPVSDKRPANRPSPALAQAWLCAPQALGKC
jgi:hypothetical protein